MRKLIVIFTVMMSTVIMSCKSEKKELIIDHERDEVYNYDKVDIDINNLQEMRAVTARDSAEILNEEVYIEQHGERVYYTTESINRALLNRENLNDKQVIELQNLGERSLKRDIYYSKGDEVLGYVYKATFTVTNPDVEGNDVTVEKFYYIDKDNNYIIEIQE